MVDVKVGGKLYWGGEYAVVEPGHTAVIMAVNRYLKVRMTFVAGQGKIYSSLYQHQLTWSYKNNKLYIVYQEEYRLIIKAIEVMSEYLLEQGKQLIEFDLIIDSDLHDNAFQKYGFGSSGAVVVAIVRGMLCLYELADNDLLVFKLACLILLKIGNNGSMGDVASCTYGGLIAYTSFERREILQWLNKKRIDEIVESKWKYLRIQYLQNRLLMEPIIGWTGKVADSSVLVDKISFGKVHPEYPAFLQNSETQIQHLIQAIEDGDKEKFKKAILALRQGLIYLSTIYNTQIETEKLKQLSDLAEGYDAVGKLSGAGGGDCGIIFLFEQEKKEKILKELKKRKIKCFLELSKMN